MLRINEYTDKLGNKKEEFLNFIERVKQVNLFKIDLSECVKLKENQYKDLIFLLNGYDVDFLTEYEKTHNDIIFPTGFMFCSNDRYYGVCSRCGYSFFNEKKDSCSCSKNDFNKSHEFNKRIIEFYDIELNEEFIVGYIKHTFELENEIKVIAIKLMAIFDGKNILFYIDEDSLFIFTYTNQTVFIETFDDNDFKYIYNTENILDCYNIINDSFYYDELDNSILLDLLYEKYPIIKDNEKFTTNLLELSLLYLLVVNKPMLLNKNVQDIRYIKEKIGEYLNTTYLNTSNKSSRFQELLSIDLKYFEPNYPLSFFINKESKEWKYEVFVEFCDKVEEANLIEYLSYIVNVLMVKFSSYSIEDILNNYNEHFKDISFEKYFKYILKYYKKNPNTKVSISEICRTLTDLKDEIDFVGSFNACLLKKSILKNKENGKELINLCDNINTVGDFLNFFL